MCWNCQLDIYKVETVELTEFFYCTGLCQGQTLYQKIVLSVVDIVYPMLWELQYGDVYIWTYNILSYRNFRKISQYYTNSRPWPCRWFWTKPITLNIGRMELNFLYFVLITRNIFMYIVKISVIIVDCVNNKIFR